MQMRIKLSKIRKEFDEDVNEAIKGFTPEGYSELAQKAEKTDEENAKLTAPTTGFYMYITPARYNSTYTTSPALNLILSNGTTVSGHSRHSSITTQYKTWNSSGTVSKFSLSENNIQTNGSRANYISIYTNINGTNTYYANKLYIGGSSAGTYNLSKTFHTSDFNNGSKYLYITYYFS